MRWINMEQSFDVALRFTRNGDDRARHFQRSFLNPKREFVATAKLLAFPRSERFERMDRDHKRNSVILFGENPAKMAVPSVAMDDVGIDVRRVEISAAPHRTESKHFKVNVAEQSLLTL